MPDDSANLVDDAELVADETDPENLPEVPNDEVPAEGDPA